MNKINHDSFSTQHLALIFKYAGISFIAGSINHGAFSEGRSLLTAGLGVVFFLVGNLMDWRYSTDEKHSSLGQMLLLGAVLSVGLGFFTGGLQHFPDSPWRSVWVVPLGFVLSIIALAVLDKSFFDKAAKRYAALAIFVVCLIVFASYSYFMKHPSAGHDHGQEKPSESALHEHATLENDSHTADAEPHLFPTAPTTQAATPSTTV
ncbi:MAG TPA: hypothetical protein PLM98_18110, partial [Thiolinea sp.]|nr:hypothetical protein [Thiolinea sp.]